MAQMEAARRARQQRQKKEIPVTKKAAKVTPREDDFEKTRPLHEAMIKEGIPRARGLGEDGIYSAKVMGMVHTLKGAQALMVFGQGEERSYAVVEVAKMAKWEVAKEGKGKETTFVLHQREANQERLYKGQEVTYAMQSKVLGVAYKEAAQEQKKREREHKREQRAKSRGKNRGRGR